MSHVPQFLSIARWTVDDRVFEIASRRRLDTRQVVPYFVRDGLVFAGVLDRSRVSRALRGDSVRGYEPIGFDFSRVDEAADILHYGQAIFSERASLTIDSGARAIALPSLARSIGYLTELALPLAIPVKDPGATEIPVAWDGESHAIRFAPATTWVDALDAPDAPRHTEDLRVLLRALTGPAAPRALAAQPGRDADAWIARHADRIWDGARLARAVETHERISGAHRIDENAVDALRFLRLDTVDRAGTRFEIVTPHTGTTLAALPFVRDRDGNAYALLWREPRASVLERHERQPLYDLPIHFAHVNATASYLTREEAIRLGAAPAPEALAAIVARMLSTAFGGDIAVTSTRRIGPALETCPSTSTELRHRVVCEIDPHDLAIPANAFLVRMRDLSRAVAWGRVRDPVIVAALAEAGGAFGVDPFADVRVGDVTRRRAFLDTMTRGSIVQRRLQSYSSIEAEQLEAKTYARLMTLLQHEYGVRVAYPSSESDRSFFKAAFRVFMAANREENRALQGLHWSHDAFHFALGNYTTPPDHDLAGWYVSDAPMPAEREPVGPAWEAYARALKSAEDEATFFSFWTLYAEKPSLARHVGKLTFHEALAAMGITDRANARDLFDAITARAEIPSRITAHPHYARPEVRGLFEYMRGFRDYHLKDIRVAWKYASRDPYRELFIRFGLYESDVERYVAGVKSFQARLDAQPPGLDPLLAAAGDARVALSLRVWDVVKALRMVRAATRDRGARARVWQLAMEHCARLTHLAGELARTRREVGNAEMTPWNERVFAESSALATQLEAARDAWWDAVATLGVLDDAAIAGERVRELPR
jgi:hypothetical protein